MSTGTDTLTTASTAGRPLSLLRLAWAAPVAGVVAGVASMVVHALASAAGVEFLMPQPGVEGLSALPVFIPLLSSIIYTLLAAIVLAVINRFAKNPIGTWLYIAVPMGFVLSFLPFMQLIAASVAASTMVALAIMHVVAAPIVAGGLVWLSKRRT